MNMEIAPKTSYDTQSLNTQSTRTHQRTERPQAHPDLETTRQNRQSQTNTLETQKYAEANMNPAQLRFNDRQPIATRDLNRAYEPSTDPNRSQLDNTIASAQDRQGNNALGGQLDNTEVQELRTLIQNQSISPRQIAGDIVNNPRLSNNAGLRSSVEGFMRTLNSDGREGLAYTRHLLSRENNPLTDTQLTGIFDRLTQMSSQTYDQRAGNTRDLVMAGLHDITVPSDIYQSSIGTCASASVQTQLAIRHPERYLDMLNNLASNQPYSRDSSSEAIPPNWSFATDSISDNRTISSRIMQNSITDFADGNRRNYNSQDNSPNAQGLGDNESVKAYNNLFDNRFIELGSTARENPNDFRPNARAFDTLLTSNPSRSNPIQINIRYEDTSVPIPANTDPNSLRHQFHAVNVIGINQTGDKPTVRIINPHGREEVVPLQTIRDRLANAITMNNPSSGNPTMIERFFNNLF